MPKNQNIKIGDATITPAALSTLEAWTGGHCEIHSAEEYADWIDELKDRFLEYNTKLDFDSEIEVMKLHSDLFRLFLNLRKDLLTFAVQKGGDQ